MELIILFVVVGGFFATRWLLKPLKPIEIETKELTVYVGRATHWNLRSGVIGGKKILLYNQLPPTEHFDDSNAKSDGTFMGDFNKIYRGLKQAGKDIAADYEAQGALAISFTLFDVTKPLTELIPIPSEVLERQAKLADCCVYGDKVRIVIHHVAFRRDPKKVKPNERILTWIELAERLEQLPKAS